MSFPRTRGDSSAAPFVGKVFENLEAYVKALGGDTVIRKILIANNGIAAVKAIRFLRKWAYEVFGNEKEVLCEGYACKCYVLLWGS